MKEEEKEEKKKKIDLCHVQSKFNSEMNFLSADGTAKRLLKAHFNCQIAHTIKDIGDHLVLEVRIKANTKQNTLCLVN